MPDVTFVVKARPAAVGVSAHGRRRVLVRIPMLKVEATAEPVCPRGGVRFGANSVQLLDGTEPFDDVPAAPSVTFTMGGHRRPADTEGRDGDERVVTLTMSLNEIKVRVEVVVERRFNTAPVAGQRGRGGRPLAVPDYRARARTTITCKLTQSIAGWKRVGGIWQELARQLPATTQTEEGLFGDRVFLHDAVCEPAEPPAGTRYNSFEDVGCGTYERTI
jgi:hypothetical protein